MKLLPSRAAPHHQRSGRRDYPAAIETTAGFQFVLVSRHLFFSPRTFFSAAGGEKKIVGRKWHFWFPQCEHSTALSQHLLTPSINGLLVSAGIPSAPTARPQIWDPSHCGATI